MNYKEDLFSTADIPMGIPLSQYTNYITHAVASSPALSGVWVIAELSDVRVAGGHCYMELVEKNEAGQTVAKLRATIWRNTYLQLRKKFIDATNTEISNGIKALVRGSATHHAIYGLSFNIYDIDPSYTMGDMERLRREIILKLQKEGLADLNKKIPFPTAPQKIAVISAEGAAGYGDFINHLLGNSSGFVFYPFLFPCIMQGDRVSESIRRAICMIESMADFWDCVVIIRGGGATTDLNGFDDYELARAVATCGLPVVVGIGHERDRNVLDEIANTSLKTPTAVAGFFIDKAREAYERVVSLTDRIRIYSSEMMLGEERRLSGLKTMIPQLAIRRLDFSRSLLHSLSSKLPLLTQGRLGKENIKLHGMISNLQNLSQGKFNAARLQINSMLNLLKSLSSVKIENEKEKLNNKESLINVLNPVNTMKRGYSVTRINGKAVTSVKELNTKDKITTTLADGEILSTVD